MANSLVPLKLRDRNKIKLRYKNKNEVIGGVDGVMKYIPIFHPTGRAKARSKTFQMF